MKTIKMSFAGVLFLFASLFIISSCDDDNSSNNNGNVKFEITDAPVDDPNVDGVFVTITDVKVNGQSISDFEGPMTINLMDFRDGELKRLGYADLTAGTYSDVTLQLNFANDQSGTAPGAYIRTKDGVKHELAASSNTDNEIEVNGSFTVDQATNQENVVIDFDLRKAIQYSQNPADSSYNFVTDAELDQAARLVTKDNTGTIQGNFKGALTQTVDVIVVYAYKTGTYTNAEREGQGTSKIEFKNAVTSTIIGDDKNFTLSFLPEGTYELQFVGYEDTDNDGTLEMMGSLLFNVLGDINPNNVTVNANEKVDLNLEITGLNPF